MQLTEIRIVFIFFYLRHYCQTHTVRRLQQTFRVPVCFVVREHFQLNFFSPRTLVTSDERLLASVFFFPLLRANHLHTHTHTHTIYASQGCVMAWKYYQEVTQVPGSVGALSRDLICPRGALQYGMAPPRGARRTKCCCYDLNTWQTSVARTATSTRPKGVSRVLAETSYVYYVCSTTTPLRYYTCTYVPIFVLPTRATCFLRVTNRPRPLPGQSDVNSHAILLVLQLWLSLSHPTRERFT